MRTRFYTTSSKWSQSTQTVKKKTKRPQLTKEARIAVNARRRVAAHNYKNDLEEAWAKIDEVTEDLALTHHKSVRRVQSELHMGRQLATRERKKTNAWNAFCWKKSQDKENGNAPILDPFNTHLAVARLRLGHTYASRQRSLTSPCSQ